MVTGSRVTDGAAIVPGAVTPCARGRSIFHGDTGTPADRARAAPCNDRDAKSSSGASGMLLEVSIPLIGRALACCVRVPAPGPGTLLVCWPALDETGATLHHAAFAFGDAPIMA